MDFRLNEIVMFGNTEAEVLATKHELGNNAEIELLVNKTIVKKITYSGNFDYLIGINKKNLNDIGSLIFCAEEEIAKK